MEITVSWSAFYEEATLAQADALGPRLRFLTVALLDAYTTATRPADNFTASIPWTRASRLSAGGASAACYNFGASAAAAHPDTPVGLLINPWGGVAIQVWMSPKALATCNSSAAPVVHSAATRHALHIVAAAERAATQRAPGATGSPVIPSCLYNSMMAPLLSIPITALLWYQGESNSADPLGYECLQRAMVNDFRASWAAAGAASILPFAFVQLACWPTGAPDNLISHFRYAQAVLAREPRTGMAVSADLCDPAGAFHPIHPPWKEEVARRLWLWADAEIYSNASSPRAGPVVTSLTYDAWDPSWGDFHYGTGTGSYVCESGGVFGCAGMRLTFDRPVALRQFYVPSPANTVNRVYGFAQGAATGFAVAANQSLVASWSQPVTLTSVSADGLTVQLNLTYIGPGGSAIGGSLFYAWGDYPSAMPLVEASSGLPVAQFNVTIPFPQRPTNGTCTTVADTDGAADGVLVPGDSAAACCAECWKDERCVQVAFDPSLPNCWLKFGAGTRAKKGTTLCVLDL